MQVNPAHRNSCNPLVPMLRTKMRKSSLHILIGLLFTTISLAQSSFPNFVRSFGGTDTEIARSIISLPDSGYVISGSSRTYGPGNVNVYIIRTNKYGDTLWTKVIGNGGESGYCVRLTHDHKLILANSQSMLVGNGTNLMKMDLNGNLLWSKAYGGTSVDFIYDFKITADNGCVAIGNSVNATTPLSDLFIMKTDSNGVLQWGKHYGGAKSEYGNSIVEIPGNGYIAMGSTNSYNGLTSGSYDAMLLRINNIGDTIWTKRYSQVPYSVTGTKVNVLNNGDFLLSGGVYNTTGMMNDIFLVRTDSIGDTIWTKQYVKPFDETIGNIIPTNNDGFLIAGQTASPGGADWDIYLIQTDSIGDTLWTKALGGIKHDVARDIIPIQNGYALLSQSLSYSVTGIGNDYDMVLATIDTIGNGSCISRPIETMTTAYLPLIVSKFSPPIDSYCIQVNNSPPITSGGILNDWCGISTNSSSQQLNKRDVIVFPNPFSFGTTLRTTENLKDATLNIYNTLGEKVVGIGNISGKEIKLYRDNLVSGIYFIRLTQNGKLITTEKLIIVD